MDNQKNSKKLSAFGVTGQIVFIVTAPLIGFSVGGSWLVEKFEFPVFMKIVFVIFGVLVMMAGLAWYFIKLFKFYKTCAEKVKEDKYLKYKFDGRDYDFYDENSKKRL